MTLCKTAAATAAARTSSDHQCRVGKGCQGHTGRLASVPCTGCHWQAASGWKYQQGAPGSWHCSSICSGQQHTFCAIPTTATCCLVAHGYVLCQLTDFVAAPRCTGCSHLIYASNFFICLHSCTSIESVLSNMTSIKVQWFLMPLSTNKASVLSGTYLCWHSMHVHMP